jgi:hypothetical protein
MNVTIASGTPTYTITKANLTIANNASTSTYDGTSTYANLVSAAGYTVTGLVTSIGAVSTGDAVTAVTQTIKSGATVASGTAVTGVAQAGSFNAVPSAALGVGLSNYNITYTGVASTVSQAAITITASNDTKVYGSTSSGLGYNYVTASATSTVSASGGVGYDITSGQLIGSDSITGLTLTSVGGVATSGVGSYTITPSAATGVANYNITYASGDLVVGKKALIVSAVADAKFGQGREFVGAQAVDAGLVDKVGSYEDERHDLRAAARQGSSRVHLLEYRERFHGSKDLTAIFAPAQGAKRDGVAQGNVDR